MRLSVVTFLLFTLLSGCTPSRYQQEVDSVPTQSSATVIQAILNRAEPVPVREEISRRGNASEYEVWGKTYQVQRTLTSYRQQGIASWYGQKFHGHETSNGEIFDVFRFTAAHKSLPLPSYVRVTNLANQKSLVVRVNDRGPFHEDRLIDLSYAAAVRLDFAQTGTANVDIELIAAPLQASDFRHIQIEAFSQPSRAEELKQKIEAVFNEPAHTELNVPVYIEAVNKQSGALHKVRLGPIAPNDIERVQTILAARKMNPGMIL